jgi:hypothetical protein
MLVAGAALLTAEALPVTEVLAVAVPVDFHLAPHRLLVLLELQIEVVGVAVALTMVLEPGLAAQAVPA